MDASLVIQFWIVAITLTFTPGADWAYVISAGVRSKSVFPAIAGIVTGYVFVITLVALGVGALVAAYPLALDILTFAGAIYLLWLGISTLVAKIEPVTAGATMDTRTARQFWQGAGISAINPKGILLLIALLPQFTDPNGWHSTAQMFVLGGIHLLDSAVVYTGVGLAAQRILRSRPRASVIVTRASGLIMTAFGAVLLTQRLLEVL